MKMKKILTLALIVVLGACTRYHAECDRLEPETQAYKNCKANGEAEDKEAWANLWRTRPNYNPQMNMQTSAYLIELSGLLNKPKPTIHCSSVGAFTTCQQW